jgi:polar amino acid transport system substrate-binding protein
MQYYGTLVSFWARLSPVMAVVCLVLIASPGWAQSRSVEGARTRAPVIVGGDHYHPPYEFLDEDGQPAGYNVELTRAIAEVMGLEVEIVLGGWADMRQALEDGQVDILQGMSYSQARAKTLDFSPAHTIVHQSIFARRGDPLADVAGLRGKEVIVQQKDIMHEYLLEHQVGAEIVTTDTHADALRLLAAGEHDYALVANLPALYLSQQLGLSNIVPVANPFSLRYGYAVKKGHSDLLAKFSEGLAILKNTGRHQAIYDKWLGPLEETSSFPWKKIGQVGAAVSAVLLLILGGIVVWNRMLKREVASRTDELRQQQLQLIQADKMTSLGILVSGVAHEINNPCSFLLFNLPIVHDACRDSHDILEAHYQAHGDFEYGGLAYSRMRDEIPLILEGMQEGAQRIRRIVGDLKDFARQGDADLNESLDLNEVVAKAVRLVDKSIRIATDRFETEFAQALPAVRGNGQRIEQVVINLILNACQALDGPGQGICLRTYKAPAANRVILEVRDQGRGIDPASKPRLTDPFFTTRRDSGGTGLGLSVSAGIVREHGGTLHFESSPGQGTCVTLSLPALTAGAPDAVLSERPVAG